jgi:hypothetical protein
MRHPLEENPGGRQAHDEERDDADDLNQKNSEIDDEKRSEP